MTTIASCHLQIASNNREIPINKTYNIGLSLALTGPTSEVGIIYANGIMVAQLVTETIKRVKSKGLEVTRDNLKIEMDQMNGENAFFPYTTVGPVTFSTSDHAGVNTLQMYNIQEGVFKPFGEAFITKFL